MRFSRVKLTNDTPNICKPYPLEYATREELWNEVDIMLKMRVVRPLTSPYESLIIIVMKEDCFNRVCDFSKLNKIYTELMTEDIFRARNSCPRPI